MRILFMGTPDFAVPSLKRLHEDGHTICGVYTQPDKPKNRGMKLAMSPVKTLAEDLGFQVFQPNTLRDGLAASQIRALSPELIAVVAYGKILPKDILEIPPMGCINIHGSLLPKYRGSAPIQRAVLNGEPVTGVTAMYMAEEMDAGDMIAVIERAIGPDETSGEVFSGLSELGAKLLSETVNAIGAGTARRTPQNHALATFAPPLKREECPIDWTKSAAEVFNHIRGMNPWPVATATIAGIEFKIFSAVRTGKKTSETPGTLVGAGAGGIEIAASDETVSILELQAPAGKRMSAADYLRGHPLCQ